MQSILKLAVRHNHYEIIPFILPYVTCRELQYFFFKAVKYSRFRILDLILRYHRYCDLPIIDAYEYALDKHNLTMIYYLTSYLESNFIL